MKQKYTVVMLMDGSFELKDTRVHWVPKGSKYTSKTKALRIIKELEYANNK